jgi:hypothetical protein
MLFLFIFFGLILIDDRWFVAFIAVTGLDPYIYLIWLGGDASEVFSFFRLIDNHWFVCLIGSNVHWDSLDAYNIFIVFFFIWWE